MRKRWIACVSFISLSFIVSGCSGINHPFGKEQPLMTASIASVPQIYMASLEGLPVDKSDRLGKMFAAEAAKHKFSFTGKETPQTYRLTADFSTESAANSTAIAHNWTITNAEGKKHTISGRAMLANIKPGDSWKHIDDKMLKRIARQTVTSLALWIKADQQRKYIASVMPPPNLDDVPTKAPSSPIETVRVGQANPHQLPKATLTSPMSTASIGPGSPLSLGKTPKLRILGNNNTARQPAKHRGQEISARQLAHQTASPHAALSPQARTAMLKPVIGASPKANLALTRTMYQSLKSAGYRLVRTPSQGTAVISGLVKMGPSNGDKQLVTLSWRIFDTEGLDLGAINQSNYVSLKSLEGDWNGGAQQAAAAAALSIAKLLKRPRLISTR